MEHICKGINSSHNCTQIILIIFPGILHQAAGHPDPAPDHCVDGGLPEAKHQVLAGEGNQGGHRGHHHRGRQQVQAIQGVDLDYWIYINGTMVLNQYISP